MVQSRVLQASAHCGDAAIFSTSEIIAWRWVALTPGGANTPRQLNSSTSMPCSFSVGASMPVLALVGRDRDAGGACRP